MKQLGYWLAYAEYADGESIEKAFPYAENGNVSAENRRQYELEYWLILRHDDCIFYSVSFVEEI